MLPAKGADGLRPYPTCVGRWVNIAALGDKATGKGKLAPRFGPGVEDHRVNNGHRHHDPEPYLNAAMTGAVVAAALEPTARH